MKSHQIEAWVLSIVDRVKARQPVEDSRVDLKGTWPDPQKAARQIAAHANAARGESILWIIGIDEKTGVVAGAPHADLAVWSPAVQAEFNEVSPAITDVAVLLDGKTLVALLFDTSRYPFVVKNPVFGTPGGGSVSLEVPWREGTTTKSAGRSQLLRLLSPLEASPIVEVLGGHLSLLKEPAAYAGAADTPFTWVLKLELYVIPKGSRPLIIPFHHCSASAQIHEHRDRVVFASVVLGPPSVISVKNKSIISLSETTRATRSEAIVDGPGKLQLSGVLRVPSTETLVLPRNAQVEVDLLPAGQEKSVSFTVTLTPVGHEGRELAKWAFVPSTKG